MTRSPYTQKYEPGSVADSVPLEDHATFKDIEKTLNAIMQNYVKMYYGEGTGNFYSLIGDETTLRGLFIVQSTNKEQKKVANGSWKAMAPVVCKVTTEEDGKRSVVVDIKHSAVLHYECESKYFGKLSISSWHELPAHKELSDPEKYTDKSLNQLYVKHIGRTFEELETRVLRAHFDVYYSRLKDVG